MSRWFIASSATEVLAFGSTLNDRRRCRAEQYWQNAHATFLTGCSGNNVEVRRIPS